MPSYRYWRSTAPSGFCAFAAEKIESRLGSDHTIIDPETLLNHLARFTEPDLETGFLQHLEVIRRKRWLRGGVYAVDAHDTLIPHGKGYEGARDRRGLLRLQAISAAQHSARLRTDRGLRSGRVAGKRNHHAAPAVGALEPDPGPLREWRKILLMDRGYWGTDLFCELKQDYGIDFVSRVRDAKLDIRGSIQRQLEEPERRWTSIQEQRQFSGRKETQNVRLLASDHVNQRRNSRSSSNRGAYRDGSAILHGRLSDPGQEWQGYLSHRLRRQPCAGNVRSEGGPLLSRPLGHRESRVSFAVADLGDRFARPGIAMGRCWRGWCSCL